MMDPLTQALALANTVAQIILLTIQSQPEETRADMAKIQLAQLQDWRTFLDRFKPHSEEKP